MKRAKSVGRLCAAVTIVTVSVALGLAASRTAASAAEPDPAVAAVYEIPGEFTTQLAWSHDEAATLLVPYGTSREYGAAWAGATPATEHTILLEGLDCGTTYYFYVIATFAEDVVVNGPGQEFSTLPCQPAPVAPPDVFVVSSATSAEINWVSPRPTTGVVVYGPDTSYGLSAGSAGPATAHSVLIEGLECGATYQFSLVWTDDEGVVRSTSNQPFATDPCSVIVDDVRVAADTSSATISWTTNVASDGLVLFGPDASYGNAIESPAHDIRHEVELAGLECGSEYNFSVVAAAPDVRPTSSSNRQFVTQACLPLIIDPEVSVAGATMAVTWATDVATTGEVLVGSAGGSWQVIRGAEPALDHHLVFAGVDCGTEVEVRITATGDSGTSLAELSATTEPCGPLDFLDFWFAFGQDSVELRWSTDRAASAAIVIESSSGEQVRAELLGAAHRHEIVLGRLGCDALQTVSVTADSGSETVTRTVSGRTADC